MLEVGDCPWEEMVLLAMKDELLEENSSLLLSTQTYAINCIPVILDVSECCSTAI